MKKTHWEQARIGLACGDIRPLVQHLRACEGTIHPMLTSEISRAEFVLFDPALRGGAVRKFHRDWAAYNNRLAQAIRNGFKGNVGVERCHMLADMLEGKWLDLLLKANAHRKPKNRPRMFDAYGEYRVKVFLEKRLRAHVSRASKFPRQTAIDETIKRFGGSTSAIGKILDADREKHDTIRGIGSGIYMDD